MVQKQCRGAETPSCPATSSALATGGDGLTLQIVGNPTLLPLALKIVTSAGQVGITGSTYLVGRLGLRFDTLGSADGSKTFRLVDAGTMN